MKLGCVTEEKKSNLDKGLGCPKSQSFYTGVNLVPGSNPATAVGNNSSSSDQTLVVGTGKTNTMSTTVDQQNARVSFEELSEEKLFEYLIWEN